MKTWMKIVGAVAAVSAVATVAYAQNRDPAYSAARSVGKVGEQMDGYLGFPTTPDAATRAIANDINIKRKANYTQKAAANGSTVEEFAFTMGCNLISQTAPGEKYQAPDGSWQTRGAGAPQKNTRCP